MRKLGILFAALAFVAAQPATAQNRPEIGRINNVTPGGVEVFRSGQTRPASSGFRLQEGDIVITGRGQRVGITFVDDTRMAVAPGSRVIISRYRYDRARETGESLLEVNRGAVGVDSGNLSRSGRMRFRTPTSTLGVRGTTFVIEVEE